MAIKVYEKLPASIFGYDVEGFTLALSPKKIPGLVEGLKRSGLIDLERQLEYFRVRGSARKYYDGILDAVPVDVRVSRTFDRDVHVEFYPVMKNGSNEESMRILLNIAKLLKFDLTPLRKTAFTQPSEQYT